MPEVKKQPAANQSAAARTAMNRTARNQTAIGNTASSDTTPSVPRLSSDESTRPGIVARVLIAAVRFYQRGVSPLLGSNCRFHPTCSEYMVRSIGKYGVARGIVRGTWRILRCHPFSRGGSDPP